MTMTTTTTTSANEPHGVHSASGTPGVPGVQASYLLLKSRVDPYLALVVLSLTAPLLLFLIWLVRRDGHPAFFRQTRAGRDGRPFTLLKFRTMRTDTDPFGDSPQDGADPRITPIGRWLRETSLDELPQLINVLRGEMALVGPRPLYIQQMREWSSRQRRRLLVKPGLTGLAQISGRGSLTIEEKLELDVRYVERVSLWTDLRIIGATIGDVLGKGDIYEVRYSQTRSRRSEQGDVRR